MPLSSSLLKSYQHKVYSPENYVELAGLYDSSRKVIRFLMICISLSMVWNMASPALWILTSPSSIMAEVADRSASAQTLGWIWASLCFCVLPYMLCHIIGVTHKATLRPCARLACLATCGAGMLWGWMAWLSSDTGQINLLVLFGINSLIDFLISTTLGIYINENQKLRAKGRRYARKV